MNQSNVENRARLLAVSAPNATDWLNVIPSPSLKLDLQHPEFIEFIGIHFKSSNVICPSCNSVQLDPLGTHAKTCASPGDRTLRHNSLRNQFHQDCMNAQLTPSIEKKVNGTRMKPGDVTIPSFSSGSDTYCDWAVTSPLQPLFVEKLPNVTLLINTK